MRSRSRGVFSPVRSRTEKDQVSGGGPILHGADGTEAVSYHLHMYCRVHAGARMQRVLYVAYN